MKVSNIKYQIENEAGGEIDAALIRMEERYAALCQELAELELRLRRLRTAADLCPQCGGTGERWVRSGMYGELQKRPCGCDSDPCRS